MDTDDKDKVAISEEQSNEENTMKTKQGKYRETICFLLIYHSEVAKSILLKVTKEDYEESHYTSDEGKTNLKSSD